MHARQQREGKWGLHCECPRLELSLSELMLRVALEAISTSMYVIAQPLPLDALFRSRQQRENELHLFNQSGCELRCYADRPVDGRANTLQQYSVLFNPSKLGGGVVVIPAGEQAQLALELPLRGPLPLQLGMRAGARWYVLPPLPSRKSGSWTVFAKPIENAGVETAGAMGEPLPFRITLRTLVRSQAPGVAKALGGAEALGGGGGMQLVVRSLMSVHNGTSVPLQLQLLLSDAVATSEQSHSISILAPHLQTRSEFAMSASRAECVEGSRPAVPASLVAASYISELGTLLPGSSVSIPPHLSCAKLRIRPVTSATTAHLGAPQPARTLPSTPHKHIYTDLKDRPGGHRRTAPAGSAHPIAPTIDAQVLGNYKYGPSIGAQRIGAASPMGVRASPMDTPLGASSTGAPPSSSLGACSASFAWPLEASAFWLGQCHHTRRQTRALRQLPHLAAPLNVNVSPL